jgi:hypothetical protein
MPRGTVSAGGVPRRASGEQAMRASDVFTIVFRSEETRQPSPTYEFWRR